MKWYVIVAIAGAMTVLVRLGMGWAEYRKSRIRLEQNLRWVNHRKARR